ncbi:hypothetical protein SBA3_320012 [Candidatus Sulfopaludibacter sp. SbA3]|nr:hypothetical protein SBA3_320012 [Candidatus Sulfopaludibacter sp. SbA3]
MPCAIICRHLVPSAQQIPCHARAHLSKSKKCNVHIFSLRADLGEHEYHRFLTKIIC